MSFLETIMSGENFQKLCDVYLGMEHRGYNNPRIMSDVHKHKTLASITTVWDNPTVVYCYGDGLRDLIPRIQYFKNKFVLISHNSDANINETYMQILEHPLLVKWFAQNVMMEHPKLHILPIGIANQMWNHGNVHTLANARQYATTKEDRIYFFFNTGTNVQERVPCKNRITNKGLAFGSNQSHADYLRNMAGCKFAISPPGNGVDCHRIWECYYLNVIPILLRSSFTEQLQRILPCILLTSWDDFDQASIMCQYDTLISQLDPKWIDVRYFKTLIETAVHEA
jgi:hypothetical protein